jgi:hypothetical protein
MSEERETSQKYMATNNNQTHEEWNADCIFASDNNMKYGYGLLINTDGTFMKKAQYNGAPNAEYPEQHLANRVASYWSVSRRRMGVELRANTRTTNGILMSSITPRHLLTIDGTKMPHQTLPCLPFAGGVMCERRSGTAIITVTTSGKEMTETINESRTGTPRVKITYACTQAFTLKR